MRDYFDRPVLDVARDLLGAHLTVRGSDGVVTVRITEVEAYDGAVDPGSHAYRGRTARNATMFGEPGHLYVYRHMGLHHCANLVCGPGYRPSGVLLRGAEVTDGASVARRRREASGVARTDHDLARGPARLTVALGITRSDDGTDVTAARGRVTVEPHPGPPSDRIVQGPRVGVSGEGGRADLFPWRFWLDGDPTVSVYRAAPVRGRAAAGPPPGARR